MSGNERRRIIDLAEERRRAQKIARLNDQLRREAPQGAFLMTSGVRALGSETIDRIVKIIREYRDFSDLSDPYGEHDFGAFSVDDSRLFWKIDYYDLTVSFGSHDPTDPSMTTRILTVMLAEEY